MKPVYFKTTPENYENLRTVTFHRKITKTDFLNSLIEDFFQKNNMKNETKKSAWNLSLYNR